MMIPIRDPIIDDELESKYLWYIDRSSPYPAILIRIDLENWATSKHEDDFLVWCICNLPNNELVLECFRKDIGHYYAIEKINLTLEKFNVERNSFMHSGSLYHKGEIYTFWGECNNLETRFSNKINLKTNRSQKLCTFPDKLGKCSCIEFMGKIIMAWYQSWSLYIYDEYIDSYSELRCVWLKENRQKLLCKKENTLYLIDFPGRIYMTSSPFSGWKLLYQEKLKLLPAFFDHHTYFQGSIWYLSDKNIYKFNFDKTGIQYVGYIFESQNTPKVYLDKKNLSQIN